MAIGLSLNSIDIRSTAQTASWEDLAAALFSIGPVGILEGQSITARVTGYVDDPTYGKLIRIERIDEGGNPIPEEASRG